MVVTLFSTFSTSEVLAALRSAEEDLASGSAIIAAGSGDVNSQRAIQQNITQRIARLQYSLYQRDPVTYAHFIMAMQNKSHVRGVG